jgi:hypothetical protein
MALLGLSKIAGIHSISGIELGGSRFSLYDDTGKKHKILIARYARIWQRKQLTLY